MSGPPDWVQDSVFYQIFVDRFADGDPSSNPPDTTPWGQPPIPTAFFGGDVLGIQQRLHYLVDLGINAIYLSPVFTSPSNHKYDTEDYMHVDPSFGGDSALVALVQSAHDLGIRVVLDGVFSHTGDRFFAFRDLEANGDSSRFRDWYAVERFPIQKSPPNYRASGGAAFLPQLRTSNPEVRAYLISVARHWLETSDVDGWRLDVPWEQDHELWRELRKEVKRVRPDAYLVGEAWGDGSPWLQGDEFDGVTNYRLRELLFRFMLQRAIDAETFDRELRNLIELCPAPFRYSQLNLLGSHDTPRLATLTNHHPAGTDQMLVFLLSFLGAPLIYYGDEVGLEGGVDPDCRRCMDWTEQSWNRHRWSLVRQLAHLRREQASLRRGTFQSLRCQARCYAFVRRSAEQAAVIVINAGFQSERLSLPVAGLGSRLWNALRNETIEAQGGALTLDLEAGGFGLFLTSPVHRPSGSSELGYAAGRSQS